MCSFIHVHEYAALLLPACTSVSIAPSRSHTAAVCSDIGGDI